MARRGTKTPAKTLEAFLDELSQHGSVTDAAEATGLNRRTVYRIRETDDEFAERWDAAVEQAMDHLEHEAYRRAYKGVEEPVYQQGRLVGYKQRFSDTLLMFLLNGRRPSVYKHRTELTGKDGGPLEVDLAGYRERLASRLAAGEKS